ncbi:MAG: PAC2 family protein [Thermoplasmata archaeon]|nr:PAC2 family protein [Thermoplasmata archaeon]
MEFEWQVDSGAKELEPDAVLLCGFAGAGLAATVAAHYMVRALGLPRIAILRSAQEIPIAIVQNGRVQPPIRVHGAGKIAIALSEFPPPPVGLAPLADVLLAGAAARKVRLLLALEGVLPHPLVEGEGEESALGEEQAWVITSRPDPELLASFRNASARPLADAVLAGVAGALLVRSQNVALPVGALLVSARDSEGFPDHRAAAALIETVARLLPDLKIDTGPLRTQAEVIERALRAAMQGRKQGGVPAKGTENASIYQ